MEGEDQILDLREKNVKGGEKETDDGQLVSAVVLLLLMSDINDGERRLCVVVMEVAGEVKMEEKSATKRRLVGEKSKKINKYREQKEGGGEYQWRVRLCWG